MGLFPWRRARPAPAARPSPPPPRPFAPRVKPAPMVVPSLPVFPDDALAADVARLWAAFRLANGHRGWPQFLADLATQNQKLAAHIAKAERDLGTYAPPLNR